jgi:DNA-binding MarR family transcriptional regulator
VPIAVDNVMTMTASAATAAEPPLPLSALLSQALVAFTIEFDNEAEHQMPHRTARHGSTPGGLWLVSMAMWLNCMRYVGTDPITVGELASRARCATNLDGMRRWGYVTLARDPTDARAKPPDEALLIAATRRGQRAQEVWRPLTIAIEARWRDRFGAAEIMELTAALAGLAGQLGHWLPDCLPILGYGLYSRGKGPGADRYLAREEAAGEEAAGERAASHQHQAQDGATEAALSLPSLLARVLLALAIAFERESRVSLAVSANLLRVLDPEGVRVRDLPAISGVSKEGLAMASNFSVSHGLIVIEANADGHRWKVARLTDKGARARDRYEDLLGSLEERWRDRFGRDAIARLRSSLERLTGPGGRQSPLFAGLEPYPDGWRAAVRPPATLPHYPMVLHRGGYPDGS